jgi:lanthanide-dependent methanol dehydrogenase
MLPCLHKERKRSSSRFVDFSLCLSALVLLASAGCKKQTQDVQPPSRFGGEIRTYAGTLEPDDGQWVRATKDYANTRYSTLAMSQA